MALESECKNQIFLGSKPLPHLLQDLCYKEAWVTVPTTQV